MKQTVKRTDFWNTYRPQITTQLRNNGLDYMIDPIRRSINRLFLLSFENGGNDSVRNSFEISIACH